MSYVFRVGEDFARRFVPYVQSDDPAHRFGLPPEALSALLQLLVPPGADDLRMSAVRRAKHDRHAFRFR
jgi:hypothetical protein